MGQKSRGGKDGARVIQVTDFSGGLNSMFGALSLGLNESLADNSQNVIGIPGRAFYCGGFTSKSAVSSTNIDNSYEFFDQSGVKHHCIFRDGQLIDVVAGSETVVDATAYTSGEDVGRTDRQGVLYYCSDTSAMRKWDGTTVSAVASGPKGTYLTVFAGSIIVANPTPNASTRQPGAFLPSNVNSDTFNTANMVQSGTDLSGEISFILPMGVSSTGVAPSKSLLVGKTRGNLFLYTGAIGSQSEALVNCPVGCFDPHSAVYIPSPTLYGEVIFVGSDAQLWVTNGITAEPVTLKNQTWVHSLFTGARIANTTQRFFGTYNNYYQYYLVDLGNNQQLVYRWPTKALFFINGWPSGAYMQGTDANGFTANFVAAGPNYTAGWYQVGLNAVDFGGVAPTITYQTAFLHGGDPMMNKQWEWVGLATRNLGVQYDVVAKALPSADNTVKQSRTLTFPDAATQAGAGDGLWDIGQWDVAKWVGDISVANIAPQTKFGALGVAATANEWIPTGAIQPLRSPATSFSISWNNDGNPPQFDILGLFTGYNNRSRLTAGGNKYSGTSGRTYTGTDPFIGTQPD